MAFIKLYKKKLEHNFNYLDKFFKENKIDWGVVTKLLCGNKMYLTELASLGIKEMHDTRISNIKTIKSIDPDIQTVYIKPPAKRSIPNVIKFVDVSFNTELMTIKMLSKEAVNQNKNHKVIIMVEMGDLREGVMGDELMSFYEKVFKLPNIEIIGIGTNLNCLNGVLPNHDKLIQLCLYKQLIEVKFNIEIPWISGGTSITISLIRKKQLPSGINHFRIGEALFFGYDLYSGKPVKGMETDVFKLFCEIIELHEKPMVPIGEQIENVAGYTPEVNPENYGKSSYRAIIDVGLLDVNPGFLIPVDPAINVIEASSDMLIVDLGTNEKDYKTGDLMVFNLRYMGALSIMNSNYIEKVTE